MPTSLQVGQQAALDTAFRQAKLAVNNDSRGYMPTPYTLRQALSVVHFKDGKPYGILTLSVEFRQEDSRWLAECLELGTAAYGDTLERAEAEVLEAISLQLNQVEEMGFVQKFLKEHGVQEVAIRVPRARSARKVSWAVPAALGKAR